MTRIAKIGLIPVIAVAVQRRHVALPADLDLSIALAAAETANLVPIHPWPRFGRGCWLEQREGRSRIASFASAEF